MSEVDLNLENYDLDDILKLFHLDYSFGEEEIKKIYKLVLKTHPDKSGLSKDYFIFYSKAFKKLKSIYDYKTKYIQRANKENCVKHGLYSPNIVESELKNDEIKKLLEKEDFNKWFNEVFEKVKIADEEDSKGYGDWIKSNIENNEKASNIAMMNDLINKKKVESRNNVLANYKGIQDLHSGIGVSQSSILRDELEEYSSDMFSKLKYEDLKKAHTETVIPVTDEDYHNREKYSSVDELRRRRMHLGVASEEEMQQKLNTINDEEYKTEMYRSYKMAKQMEQIENSNKRFMTNIRFLMN